MTESGSSPIETEVKKDEKTVNIGWRSRSKEIVFFSCIAGFSVLAGFATTLTMAKKKDLDSFAKGLISSREIPESGGSLALRALARGSFYAIGGFSLFCIVAWKLSGVHSMDELREKTQSVLPTMRKNEQRGRSEFSSVRELVHYLLDEDERAKTDKKKS